MGKVWNAPMDPRDYRLREQQEQYEGPGFKQMMEGTTPAGRFKDMSDTPDNRSKAWDINPQPARQAKKQKKHWYERIERTYYN